MKLTILILVILVVVQSKKIDDGTKPNPTQSLQISYENMGRDWPGKCSTGNKQSPINIVDGQNTQIDMYSTLQFNYLLNEVVANQKNKFFYDGQGLTLNANIGQMIFTHEDLTVETYKADQIILRYPSEHAITLDSQTPRYPLEMQIVHTLTKSTKQETTNKFIKVEKAILSILFKDNSYVGDRFLQRLGINEDPIRSVIPPKSYIEKTDQRFNNEFYFDIEAIDALKNILNFNHHIYRYYGSQTTPPCEEKVAWFVFAKPRAISQGQLEFIKNLIIKERSKFTGNENLNTKQSKYYGNNRGLQIYDEIQRGKIYSMVKGIKSINGLPYTKN